jgi:putative endonuclease
MAENILNGNRGESLAADHLISNGYQILARNYRFKKREIDLIALESNTLIFIEVKYRKNSLFGNPEDFVTPSKEGFILSAAENYIYETKWKGKIRFDIISITKGNSLLHFKDAF